MKKRIYKRFYLFSMSVTSMHPYDATLVYNKVM